jgi:hypothetical protein
MKHEAQLPNAKHTHHIECYKFSNFVIFRVDLTSTLGLELIIMSNGLLTPHFNKKLTKLKTPTNQLYIYIYIYGYLS